jgi:UDP-N-acetylglucosamine 1-carboxyvinyltransferase
MSKYIIKRRNELAGIIKVSGAKNMALKVLVASLLSRDTTTVTNVPEIEDVNRLIEVLTELGVVINHSQIGRYELTPENFDPTKLNIDLVSKFRASILLLGPLLANHNQVKFPHPGGCTIGKRPIDMFIEGFRAMGVKVEENDHNYIFNHNGLKGADIVFPQVTVTGTETMLLAAVRAKGITRLFNTAQEPEITALANFLNSHGAQITGAGTSNIIVKGVDKISSGLVEIIPDRIEAGSFLALACATKSHLIIANCNPEHLRIPIKLLQQMGVKLKISNQTIEVFPNHKLHSLNIKTHEYPGFPTDMQAPFTVLMTQCYGQSLIHETIWEGRLFYTDFLNRMGANIIMCDPQRVLVNGPTILRGRKLESPDLRAGIAMVIAGLVAEGTTEIDNIYQIERGYEDLVVKLKGVGALIEKIDE